MKEKILRTLPIKEVKWKKEEKRREKWWDEEYHRKKLELTRNYRRLRQGEISEEEWRTTR